MIKGSCLCGGVRFEVSKVVGPFELCHCRRCKKSSGSAFAAGIGVMTADFKLLDGKELISTYDAPILRSPPPYRSSFCRRCGSLVPNPAPGAKWFEIPAGLLDDDPGIKPDKHIFIEHEAPWFEMTDKLPRHDLRSLIELRARAPKNPDRAGE